MGLLNFEITVPGHQCQPSGARGGAGAVYKCDNCGQLWVRKYRGDYLLWGRANWWERGKIKKLLAIQQKTIVLTSEERVAAMRGGEPFTGWTPPPTMRLHKD